MAADQRVGGTFSISLRLEYKTRSEPTTGVSSGTGSVEQMSSEVLIFTADRPLSPGLGLEAVIDWPLTADNQANAELIVYGDVVSCDGLRCKVRIGRYSFGRPGPRPSRTNRFSR